MLHASSPFFPATPFQKAAGHPGAHSPVFKSEICPNLCGWDFQGRLVQGLRRFPDMSPRGSNLRPLFGESTLRRSESLLQRALNIVEKALGPEHLEVFKTLSNLGTTYYSAGRYKDAERSFFAL